MRTAKNLIRLGGRPGWSVSSLVTQVIFLVLSCGGSYMHAQPLIRTWVVALCLKLSLFTEQPHVKINKMTVHPAKTQISLGICPVWSKSWLCTQWEAYRPSFFHADSEDADQTGRVPRLIWVFAGRKAHFVGFVMRWFYCVCKQETGQMHRLAWAFFSFVVVVCLGLTPLSTIFQSYHDGVWLR